MAPASFKRCFARKMFPPLSASVRGQIKIILFLPHVGMYSGTRALSRSVFLLSHQAESDLNSI
eukprot:scaffold2881_cov113-Skeletonema_marinoi.AAC.1